MQNTAVVTELLRDLKRAFILSVPPYGVRSLATSSHSAPSAKTGRAMFCWQAEQVRNVSEKMVALWDDSELLQQCARGPCHA